MSDKPCEEVECITVSTKTTFEAAHFLPYYEGDCHNMHGHTYKWKVSVRCIGGGVHLDVSGEDGYSYSMYTNCIDSDLNSGMVMDFKVLREKVGEVAKTLDHSVLNDTIPNPTAENITLYLVTKLQELLDPFNITVVQSELWETEDNSVEWRKSSWII